MCQPVRRVKCSVFKSEVVRKWREYEKSKRNSEKERER